jgi:hypothetical protein
VGEYGGGRVLELERLLDATALADDERDDLAARARVLAGELEATADLLALLERASDPAVTDVNVELVVRETVRLSGSGRGRELMLRLEGPVHDCTVLADPYVVGPLFALMVAWVSSNGLEEVVVRVRCEETTATFTAEAAGPGDAAQPGLAMRVLPAVPPTETAAQQVAAQIGATLELTPVRGSLRLARTTG